VSGEPAYLSGIAELPIAEIATMSDPITANAVAVVRAAEDAGIPMSAIDALLTYDSLVAPDVMQANRIADYLGLAPSYASTIGAAGATPAFACCVAVGLISGGLADTIAIAHSDLRASSGPSANVVARMAAVVGNLQFEDPFGLTMPGLYSLLADWLLTRDLATKDQLALIAVAARAWAGLNPNARRSEPLTIDEVLSAPRISGPLGRLDCCLITDFSGALIVTRATGPRSVEIIGAAGHAAHEEILQLDPDDPLGPGKTAARRVYAAAGAGPEDIDVAFLYDSFTVTVALQLLAYGLDRGAGLESVVSDGGIGPGGHGLPVNTHGGLMSATTSGIFHIVEAVRQLRGEADRRQIDGARSALVTNVGGVFSNHCALILRGQI
jgi:acetyl-CoA acetyltransferase